MEKIEAAVIGAGVAGLTAGMYLHLRGRKTIIFEASLPGGDAENIPLLENYPGVESMTGSAFAEKLVNQVKQFNVPLLERHEVIEVTANDQEKIIKVQSDEGIKEYSCKIVFFCVGGDYKHLGLPGEADYQYKGISYCAVCDGSLYTGKRVAVIGNGNQAAQSAIYMSQFARKTLYVTHGPAQFDEYYRSQLEEKGVDFFEGYTVKEFQGDGSVVQRFIAEKDGDEISKKVKGIFVAVGRASLPDLPQKAGCALDDEGRIIISANGETSVPGIYAAGDCTSKSDFHVASAVGQAVKSVSDTEKYF
ncbi:MAG: NAD(P)/FAD-dependent oxidoreductase [Candidatus Hodarchaeota archaeon]